MVPIHYVRLRALCRAGLLLVCATPSIAADDVNPGEISFEGRSFAFYALSRGKGVPDATWQLLEELRTQFAEMQAQGEIVFLQDERLGLEGETRLCAEFATTAIARSTWEQISAWVDQRELELVNLTIEPCQKP